MATLQEVRDKADAILANLWVELRNKEIAYFNKHGRYFQLLITPEVTVIDGTDSDLSVRPSPFEQYLEDVTLNWASKIPFQIEVHEFPDGFTGIVTVEVNGEKYTRQQSFGNNVNRAWTKVTAI